VGVKLSVKPRFVGEDGAGVRVAFGIRHSVEQKIAGGESGGGGKAVGSVVQTVFVDFGGPDVIGMPKYMEECGRN